MNCEQAKQDILAADDLDEGILAVLKCADHLTSCPHCQAFVAQLRNLEAATGNLRTPARIGPTPEFYTRLDEMISRSARTMDNLTFRGVPRFSELPEHREESVATLRPHFTRYRWKAIRQRAAAAIIFAMVGLTIVSLVLFNGSQAQAAVLLDQLVDWNVQISAATTPADRAKLYQEGFAKLSHKSRTSLSIADQQLVDLLEATAKWLVNNDDPIEVAGRFVTIADKLQERQAMTTDPPAAEKVDQLYRKVVTQGIAANLRRVDQAHLDPQHRSRLDAVRSQAQKHLDQTVNPVRMSDQVSDSQPLAHINAVSGVAGPSANLVVLPPAGFAPTYVPQASSSLLPTTSAHFSAGTFAIAGNTRSSRAAQTVIRPIRISPGDSIVLPQSTGSTIAAPPPSRQSSNSSDITADLAAPAQQSVETAESATSAATISSFTDDAEDEPVAPVAVVTPLSLDSSPSDQPLDTASDHALDTAGADAEPVHPWSRRREASTDARDAFMPTNRFDRHQSDDAGAAGSLAMNDPDTLIHPLLRRFDLPDDADSLPHHARIAREQIWIGHHASPQAAVPEPASLMLLGGVGSILLLRRRGRTKNQ
jgi:hypothetical protein